MARMKQMLAWGEEKLLSRQLARRAQDDASVTAKEGEDLGKLEKTDLAKACVKVRCALVMHCFFLCFNRFSYYFLLSFKKTHLFCVFAN